MSLLHLIYFLSAFLAAASFVYTLRSKEITKGSSLFAVQSCMTLSTIGYFAEHISFSPAAAFYASRVTGLFFWYTAIFWVQFVLETHHLPKKSILKFFILCSLLPVSTTLLGFTNQFHKLIWHDFHYEMIDGLFFHIIERYGSWFWFQTMIIDGLLIAGTSVYFLENLNRHGMYLRRTVLLCSTVLLPFLGNVLYINQMYSGLSFDMTPILLSLSATVLALTISNYRVCELCPPSRSQILRFMGSGILTIDEKGKIMDINPTAQLHFKLEEPPLGLSCKESIPVLHEALFNKQGQKSATKCVCLEYEDISLLITSSIKTVYRNNQIQHLTFVTSTRQPAAPQPQSLTRCEQRILQLLKSDHQNKEIASLLSISENTLKTHIKNIYKKTGIKSRSDLVFQNETRRHEV